MRKRTKWLDTRLCPKCGERTERGEYCQYCGAKLGKYIQIWKCSNCGWLWGGSDTPAYCPERGAKLK